MADYISSHTGKQIDDTVDSAVLFTVQTLSDSQKAQAISNIGAATEAQGTKADALVLGTTPAGNAKLFDGNTVAQIMLMAHPVGSIYESADATSPATLFGGTWERLKDRFLLGAGDTYTAGATGGSATQSLTADNNGPHTHLTVLNASGSGDGWGPSGAYASGAYNTATASQGSGTPFSIMPPYLVVYMWQRTA